MGYTIKVDWDAMQSAMVSALKEDLEYLKKDLKKVLTSNMDVAILIPP